AAERRRVAVRQGALVLALLQRAVGLLGGGFPADSEPAVRLALAAAATVLAKAVEAAQFATLVGRSVAAHVSVGAVLSAHVQRGLRRPALTDHGLEGQRRRRAFLELEFAPQCLDLRGRQLLGLAAQQRLGQGDLAIAHPLEAADLATLRFPQAADLAV